jgi:hypothetical protein
MSELVINAHLRAAFLFALRRVNRSACAAFRIRHYFGGGGGGRPGDCELIIQLFSVFGENFQRLVFYRKNGRIGLG